MRKSLEEIREITPWCYYHDVDLIKVYYGDCPVRTYTKKDHEWHEEISKTNKTLANLGAAEAITWSLYGDYDVYDIGIGSIVAAKNDRRILHGELKLKRQIDWYISYNSMWDTEKLNILHLRDIVQGWSSYYAFGSPATKAATKEMDEDIIEWLLNYKNDDYGEIVERFLEAARELYEKDKTNYIMEKCMTYK